MAARRGFFDAAAWAGRGAAAGFVLAASCAHYGISRNDQPNPVPFSGLHTLFGLAFLVAGTLPAAWPLLRLVAVRPAWLVAIMGRFLMIFSALFTWDMSQGRAGAWVYGLGGALGYGLATSCASPSWAGHVTRILS